MILKKLIAGFSAAAIAASLAALPAAADAPEADENGVYGTAGIIWMIRDQWDHKKDLELDPTDEFETYTISSTYHNVNITGNGQYTVDMSGYHAPQDWLDVGVEVGYLGVLCNLDFETYTDIGFELDEATIDGKTYKFEKGLNEEGEPIQVLEDSEIIENGKKMIKIKNGYGDQIKSEPEMDTLAWTTTDPLTVTFTISGLPTDKIADNPDEVIEQVYGNGSIDNDPAEGEEEEAEAETEAETEEAPAETEAAAGEEAPAETEAEKAEIEDKKEADEKEEGSNTGVIAGVVAAVVVILGIIGFAVVKKKK
ncbi:MAG: hypothetical protein K6C68_14295 [Ruminococcus sp.]|nr:hypothetical protein [Ruminococcus sp.]